MHTLTRSIGLALLLLLMFLAAALSLQLWLSRETKHLQRVAIDEQRARLGRIIAVSGLPPERWDAYFQKELGAMIGGTVELYRAGQPPPPTRVGEGLGFTMPVGSTSGWEARVNFALPALLRTQVLHQRIMAAVVLLALLLAVVPLLALLIPNRRASGETTTHAPWGTIRAEANSLQELARMTHERGTALAEEHAARARAEEDLQVNRSLLDQSVAERVRIGRDLHDNICQTLYAVGLTLESVQKKSTLTPEMQERMQQCLIELRRLSQEVRSYLQDLEPGSVNGQSFNSALAGMLGSLPAGDEVHFERRLDPETLELIHPQQVAEIMNILREAVSNSLRHGRARRIVLRAARSDEAIALSVQDDGQGFWTGGAKGHGLENMRARARGLGGNLEVESSAQSGTRVILTLPLPS